MTINFEKVLGIVLTIVGLVCVAGCFYVYQYSTWLYFSGKKTMGIVVDYDKLNRGHRYEESDIYYPIIEYTTNRGVAIKAINKTGSSETPYRVGSKVEIYYAPYNPQEVVIYSFIDLFLPIIGLAIGAFLGGGFGLLYLLARDKPSK
ncbi:DUF3592 domain-containing protein [Endozoicomonas sp. SM1973]|uniref:DUF3592 domain-containing protein n=1 Tax=Spartinivicinus marinus TaxID=2994442 RepID=A0A853HZR6_9GAMM|nr:DUF3592 domain-containing protein [Spartinivicinus marinus]MCX4029243.1 DUF3592 domain-containing protein [Spartinivicinus marinus]NYZ65849.1 DUF3592 domain-containing protein [Spartinivicinus marinus]